MTLYNSLFWLKPPLCKNSRTMLYYEDSKQKQGCQAEGKNLEVESKNEGKRG